LVLGAGEGGRRHIAAGTHHPYLLADLVISHLLFGSLCCYLAACLLEQLEHGFFTLHSLPSLCVDFELGLVDHRLEELEYVFLRLDSVSSLLGDSGSDMDHALVELRVNLLPSGYSLATYSFDELLQSGHICAQRLLQFFIA